MITLTPEQREKLQESYTVQCVEDMDMDTICETMHDMIYENLSTVPDSALIKMVEDEYPELLEEIDIA